MKTTPRVVIGVPVYNGQNYLKEAINSILAQTYTDFQLVISDNASTDATALICEEYAKQDRRVVYYRQPQNIGGAPNHNYLFEHYGKTAEYFKWQAHDDIIAPEYLEHCVKLLDANPNLAIAHCRSTIINEHSEQTTTCDHEIRLNDATPSARFWRLLWAGYFTEVFGLMRSSTMANTRLQGSFAGSDRNFVGEMLLQGDVGYVEEYLFARRDHPDCYCRLKDTAAKHAWFDPNVKKELWKLTGAIKMRTYLTAILELPMPLSDRVRCLRMLSEWTVRRGLESATGAGEQFGENFRREFAANRQWETAQSA